MSRFVQQYSQLLKISKQGNDVLTFPCTIILSYLNGILSELFSRLENGLTALKLVHFTNNELTKLQKNIDAVKNDGLRSCTVAKWQQCPTPLNRY